MEKITLVILGENQALYVGDELILKGKDIKIEEIFQALHLEFEIKTADLDWFEGQGSKFPRALSWIKLI